MGIGLIGNDQPSSSSRSRQIVVPWPSLGSFSSSTGSLGQGSGPWWERSCWEQTLGQYGPLWMIAESELQHERGILELVICKLDEMNLVSEQKS